MAKKGQKFRKFTVLEKIKVVEYSLDNSTRAASNKYNVSQGNIGRWKNEYKEGKLKSSTETKKGRKKDNISFEEKYEILKKFQDFLGNLEKYEFNL